MSKDVMPDLIRHPVYSWIPAYAGMTTIVAEAIIRVQEFLDMPGNIPVN
jgi:hypothetical protein